MSWVSAMFSTIEFFITTIVSFPLFTSRRLLKFFSRFFALITRSVRHLLLSLDRFRFNNQPRAIVLRRNVESGIKMCTKFFGQAVLQDFQNFRFREFGIFRSARKFRESVI